MSNHVEVQVEGSVLHVRFNRPEKKNAITVDMYEALCAAFDQAEADSAIHVLFITGSGDSFTAGNDVNDFLERPPTSATGPSFRFLEAITQATKPIVAGVNGMAIGIGTTMLLHFDLVYAAERATFQLPFVNLALVPEAGSSFVLPRLAGYQKAAELLFFGERFDASRAHEVGFVNDIVPDAELEAVALERAHALAAKAPAAVQQTKALLRRGIADAIAVAMKEEGGRFIERLQSAEAEEAMRAIMEGRPADFSQLGE